MYGFWLKIWMGKMVISMCYLLELCPLKLLWCLAAYVLRAKRKCSLEQHSLFSTVILFLLRNTCGVWCSIWELQTFTNLTFAGQWIQISPTDWKAKHIPTEQEQVHSVCVRSWLLAMLDLPSVPVESAPQPPAFSPVKQRNNSREL